MASSDSLCEKTSESRLRPTHRHPHQKVPSFYTRSLRPRRECFESQIIVSRGAVGVQFPKPGSIYQYFNTLNVFARCYTRISNIPSAPIGSAVRLILPIKVIGYSGTSYSLVIGACRAALAADLSCHTPRCPVHLCRRLGKSDWHPSGSALKKQVGVEDQRRFCTPPLCESLASLAAAL